MDQDFCSVKPDASNYGDLKCEEGVEFWPDGSVELGTKCFVTCQEGYELAEGKVNELTCSADMTWGHDW